MIRNLFGGYNWPGCVFACFLFGLGVYVVMGRGNYNFCCTNIKNIMFMCQKANLEKVYYGTTNISDHIWYYIWSTYQIQKIQRKTSILYRGNPWKGGKYCAAVAFTCWSDGYNLSVFKQILRKIFIRLKLFVNLDIVIIKRKNQ